MRKTYQLTEEQHNLHRWAAGRHPMTIQQTERAREILARLEEIDGNKAGAFTLRTEGAVGSVFEAKLAVVLEALPPQTSEEVVEAVARAREASPIERLAEHLAARPMPICSDDMRIMLVADWLDYSLNRCGLVVVPEQSLASEEVVEAVARAIERADNETGYEYDHLHIECSDWGIHLARAAIAAMPSIPQESDAEVTEEMLSAGAKTFGIKHQSTCFPFASDWERENAAYEIYTAMTSARDREQPK